MLCSGCGKTIPFNGQVCPYCQRDKSKDQQYTVWAFILGLGLGYLGYKLFGGWGAIIGFVIGCVIAFVISGAGKSKLPDVNVVTEKIQADSTSQSQSEDRLKKLSDLRRKGLIDESEYATKRKAILDEL
jgi:glutaredoxin